MGMGERLTGKFDQNHVDGFEAMQEEGNADSYSEAVRRASIVGLRQMGYINGQQHNTRLKKLTKNLAYVFGLIGIVWLATTITYPVQLRLPAIAAFSSAFACSVMYWLLDEYEPSISNRLKALVGRETA
jgi:hypothetical protein